VAGGAIARDGDDRQDHQKKTVHEQTRDRMPYDALAPHSLDLRHRVDRQSEADNEQQDIETGDDENPRRSLSRRAVLEEEVDDQDQSRAHPGGASRLPVPTV